MENALEIKTRTPPDLPPLKQRLKERSESLFSFTVEDLKRIYALFVGEKFKFMKKTDLIPFLSKAMTFADEKAFRDWLFSLPVLTQNLLYRLVFDHFVPVTKLETEFNVSLVQEINEYSWRKKWVIREKLCLDFLDIFTQYGYVYTVLPQVVRSVLKEWLVPPPELLLENCGAGSDSAAMFWDNSAGIADSLPLLYAALNEMSGRSPDDSLYRSIRGFKKNNTEELRASSGFKPFDIPGTDETATDVKTPTVKKAAAVKSSELAPDSTDLTARFVLAMKNVFENPPKISGADTRDGQGEAKALVNAFFSEKSSYRGYINPPDRHSLEYNVLFDHISKYTDYSLSYGSDMPPSRVIFRTVILFCAQNGGAFDADKVAHYIYRSAQNFTFYNPNIERYVKLRADAVTTDGITYSISYNDDFSPRGIMTYPLLTAPLFKAYCYLFAALGILEITQTMPPLARSQKGKNHPLSPYDSLKTFRVTEFGKWCLGLTEKRPERPKTEYQAIADKELLLVTVQGNSLERKLYLDRIGRKLGSRTEAGTDRWRISPDSFIAGCVDKKQIEERITKFKALIDPAPAPHWTALFENAVNRSGLFDKALNDMTAYRLPNDAGIAEELLRDTEFRALVHRAEGGLFIVPEKNRKKFYAVLQKHGIAVFGGG
jgi:hypothetical protein